MARVVEKVKKSFRHLVDSVTSWGRPGNANGANGANEMKMEADEKAEVHVMAIRARGPISPGKPEPPVPGTN